jgi:hypothetical protein
VSVRRTFARSRHLVDAGRLDVIHSSLEDFDGRGWPFDKVFAINVNLFWVRDATAELKRIAGWLAAGGAVFLFYEAPSSAKGREISDRVRPALRSAGFKVVIKKSNAALAIIGRGR